MTGLTIVTNSARRLSCVITTILGQLDYVHIAHKYIDFLEVALYLTNNPPHHHYPPHPHYIILLVLNIPLILIILSKCGGQRELAQSQQMRWTVRTRTKSAYAVDCENSVYVVDSEN